MYVLYVHTVCNCKCIFNTVADTGGVAMFSAEPPSKNSTRTQIYLRFVWEINHQELSTGQTPWP